MLLSELWLCWFSLQKDERCINVKSYWVNILSLRYHRVAKQMLSVWLVETSNFILIPSSYCRSQQDKTVSSRRPCELSWRQSQTQFSVVLNILETEQFCPVSSAVWTHLWTSLDPVSKYDVTTGNHVANWKLGQDKTRLSDWTKLFRNFHSPTVLTCRQFSPHSGRWQDETRQCGGVN